MQVRQVANEVLHNLSLTVDKEVCGIMGPSGRKINIVKYSFNVNAALVRIGDH